MSRDGIARGCAAVAVVIGVSLAGAGVASAGEPASAEPGPARAALPATPTESGAPDGAGDDEPADLRQRLEDAGIKVESFWYVDFSRTLDGGLRPRDTTRRTFIDTDLTLDTELLLGLPGGKVRCEVWWIGGDSAPDGSGALQDPSSLTGERRFEIGQLWYEQTLACVRLRFGKIDPTYDFAVLESGWDFLNSGVTYPPNLIGVPVYPDPAYGGELFWSPAAAVSVALGVFDGALQEGVPTGRRGPSTLFGSPADLCALAEVRTRWTLGARALPGTAVLGGWHHDGTFDTLGGARADGAGGGYVLLEQRLLRESLDDPDDVQGLTAFMRSTLADRDVSEVARHDGGGFVWNGLLQGRDDDATGLAVMRAAPSSVTGSAGNRRPETAVELFHKIQLSTALSVTLDLQYVHHPWNAPHASGALVAGLRLVVVF